MSCKSVDSEFQSALPVKVIQFGQGNFLRAFAEPIIQKMNDSGIFGGSVVIVKPTPRAEAQSLKATGCRYTVVERGPQGGRLVERAVKMNCVRDYINPYETPQRLIDYFLQNSVGVVISNTTEAGIVYSPGERFEDFPNFSYPAKLCRLLYERYLAFGSDAGLLVLPVELIENNGAKLLQCVKLYAADWSLGADFISFLDNDCRFCSTLVDRIVTGYPRSSDEKELYSRLGYEDPFAVCCEPYLSWIITSGGEELFPAHKVFKDVKWVSDPAPYRERKVRILNGTHTLCAAASLLCKVDTVRDMMNDKDICTLAERALKEEIVPTLKLEPKELEEYKNTVFERFENPFIRHRLEDIMLNCVSKFKTRCLPSVLDTVKAGGEPKMLAFSLAALLFYYKSAISCGRASSLRDESDVVNAFSAAAKTDDFVSCVLQNESLWGVSLTDSASFAENARRFFDDIETLTARTALRKALYE